MRARPIGYLSVQREAAAKAKTATEAASPTAAGQNRLLARLPAHELAGLSPHLEHVELRTLEVLVELGGSLNAVYFPLSAVLSVVRPAGDGTFIETGTVGNEGLAGIGLMFENAWSPARLETQVPGTALRIAGRAFGNVVTELPTFRKFVGAFVLSFIDQTGQSVVCNGRHLLAQRCARWLLMAHDRTQGDTFAITHEVLARMLDVRRAGVTEALVALKRAGVIDYRRGHITVVDRRGLESAACDCHAINQAHLQKLYAAE
jgi:CRP-like cAMP-binding protein